jgi:CTP:molybdopterin cytidylyltransferase MocA
MGRPKLLVPIQGQALLARVVTALREGGVTRVIVVAPPESAAPAAALAAIARRAGAEVVVPESPPPEMRDSIELGLETLSLGPPPRHVLFCPGDSPGITRELVARLLDCAARLPALGPLVPNVLIAVNEEYAEDGDIIPAGARIAVIPPVSGGGAGGGRTAPCIEAPTRRSFRP